MFLSVKKYFEFTAKERSGILVLLGFVFLFSLIPFAYPLIAGNAVIDNNRFNRELKWLATEKNYNQPRQNNTTPKSEYKKESSTAATLFYFDPNTLNAEGWMKLGIKEKTALTIQKYISKGGKFRKPEDIEKIWGLNPLDVERLIPYVRISIAEKATNFKVAAYPNKYEKKELQKVDINLADTSIFIALPGIGPGFAKRIVNFRTRLGGFYAVEQVGETYGLPDSTFQIVRPYLIVKSGNIKKININTANLEELKTHPYIRYNLANVIVNFRNQHGNFATVEDIKKIMILSDEAFDKLHPYLAVN